MGFQHLTLEQRRERAHQGSQAAKEKSKPHRWTPQEASIAGRKGGKAVSRNRQYMAEIGRKGGQGSGQPAALRKMPEFNETSNKVLARFMKEANGDREKGLKAYRARMAEAGRKGGKARGRKVALQPVHT